MVDRTDASAAELVKQLAEQTSRLVREELRSAQLEMRHKGRHAGLGIGMFGGGGLVALYGLAALFTGVVLLLAEVMPAWGAALVVAAVLLAVAGVLGVLGKKQVEQVAPPVPENTVDSVKEDIATIRERAGK